MIEQLHDRTVGIMNVAIQLRLELNDTSITLKEFQKVKGLLLMIDNLASDIVSISMQLKEKENDRKDIQ
jgi:hypothetical protein